MSKLKRMSGKEAVSILKKFGFREIRQKGSHIILKRTTSEGEIGCVIPLLLNWQLAH
ncbi:MAG: type II toxin-antitoxin system HicA family toxin [Atribacterota bacterium]